MINDVGLLHFRCYPLYFSGHERCRSTGWEEFDKFVKKDSPHWFDVTTGPWKNNTFPAVHVSASQRGVTDVQIERVSPYAGTPDTPGSPLDQLRSLSSTKITIIFGVGDTDHLLFNPLGCNQLDFVKNSPNTFQAGLCGIPNGVAQVIFTVGPEGQGQLMALKSAIDEEKANARQDIIITYTIITPIFVIFFLIISGFVWIVRRASAYVAAA